MDIDLSEEQRMMVEQLRGLIGARVSYQRLRALIDSEADHDEPLWRDLADLGVLGIQVPERHGGLGLTEVELGLVSEELGRANAAVPFFSSIVLCADLLRIAGSEEQQARWLPRLATGEVIGTVAYAEGPGRATGSGALLAGCELSGEKTPVADAGSAHIAIVQAGADWALVELDQPAVRRERLESFDQLRPHYRLVFDGAAAEPLGNPVRVESLFDRAAVQAAFEAVGAAEACLHMARGYAMERRIFGRPLASYQAIKHKLADLAVSLELARASARFAAQQAASRPHDLAFAAAAARLTSLAAVEAAVRENLQVHGGMGFTFEADCHFYYRRERLLAVSLGGRDYWADRLLAHAGDSEREAA